MSTIASWKSPDSPNSVQYSREAIENLRLLAIDGLLALPRYGIGIGGLLLGTRDGENVRVLDSEEIPCSHATGPSFVLTAAEIAQASAQVAQPRTATVVGWYISKPRGALALSDADRHLYQALCPQQWQVALLLKPSTTAPSTAALGLRDAAGGIRVGAETVLERWTPGSVAQAETPVVPPPVVAPAFVPEPPPPAPAVPPKPMFQTAAPLISPQPAKRRWIPIAAAVVLAGLAAAAFLLKDFLLPRPPLQLDSSDVAGHLTLRWNRDAIIGVDHGYVAVNDGGQLSTIPLNAGQLASGTLRYDRKSERVVATLSAGDAKALTSFVGAKPPEPTPPVTAPVVEAPVIETPAAAAAEPAPPSGKKPSPLARPAPAKNPK